MNEVQRAKNEELRDFTSLNLHYARQLQKLLEEA